ncbi:MAG TPA: murein biosynthesis integral membrane protein MurJ [Bryobacteraceae bacterium]|nr:murein biosynthesis integral membrane protein MurJ [Bryobacteraceae bacterium]
MRPDRDSVTHNAAGPRPEQGILKSAGVISAAVAASRMTGLVRESVLGWLFGAGATFDAFVLGYRIPNLARDLFAEGALASAFVPTFTRYLATRTREEARELSNVTATLLVAITGTLCALGMIFSPAFVELFASGFRAVPGKFELATQLVRIMFPFLTLIALAAQAQGILNANHQFGIPALSSSLFNIGSIVCGLTLGYWIGPRFGITPVYGMAFGILFGGLAQLLFQLPSVWRAGFMWRPAWNLRHQGVRDILKLMGPAILSGASVQINVLVNTNLAASLRDATGHVMNGPVSWLSYAFRFQQLPLGLFGISIASATLPRIARSAAHGNYVEFRETLSRSIVMILLTTIPASVGLAVVGESMIGIVYQHGRFSSFDTHQTAIALSCYAIGLAGYASVKLLSPAFYALGDARTPMIVSMASIVVNAVTAFTTVRVLGFGHAGLALSLSIVALFNSLVLLTLMRRRIGGVRAREMGISLAKIILAAALMGAVCYGLVRISPSRALNVIAGIPLGALVFYATASALRIPELAEVKATVLRKLSRGPRI